MIFATEAKHVSKRIDGKGLGRVLKVSPDRHLL